MCTSLNIFYFKFYSFNFKCCFFNISTNVSTINKFGYDFVLVCLNVTVCYVILVIANYDKCLSLVINIKLMIIIDYYL